VPVIEDEQTPWKLLKLLKFISLIVVAVFVFGLALCSKTSFLLLITFANEGTKVLPDDQRPVALLCIGCALITSSVLLFLKSIWKACYKTSKLPQKRTAALILFMEFLASAGAAILTIVAMPHFDIVTNITILNGVGIFSTLLQVVAQCYAKERNRFLVPSITAFIFLLLGYVLFVALYIIKAPTDTKMATWVGLAVGGSLLLSLNWWENYFRLICESSNSILLKNVCRDMRNCSNTLHIFSSLLRIAVTACVLGAYVPLGEMDWNIVNSIPSRETRIIAITVGVQLTSSALCHWFSLTACKMHALRRCFILPLYLASLAVMALFSPQCNDLKKNEDLSKFVCKNKIKYSFSGWSKCEDSIPTILISTSSSLAVSWWLGLILGTLHLWYLNVYRIQRTQDLFIRRLYEGAFIEQSLLLNTRFDIQTGHRVKRNFETVMIYLCATMWHETYEEMMNVVISIFRLDKYRSKKQPRVNDFIFEAHIFVDDAFIDVEGTNCWFSVISIFMGLDEKLFRTKHQVPAQKIIRTPYGGRLAVTMPDGNSIIVHFKDKNIVRPKKRWSQVMYLYYLLGWKLMAKYYLRCRTDETCLLLQREKRNSYILVSDGDTDFQPAAVMLLIDRLRMYPNVGAACGRIHPTGSGPAVWFQKFEYAISHWLQKTAEHVFGCVLCSPGCFSLFRAEALMDENVMKKYAMESKQASHYIQYDQGEDRWLCTLLLKQGWRVEYNAASDAYTNAPVDFKELYNQRRRWGPSTISKKNSSMSKPYMFYQLFTIISVIMSPATICLLIASSLRFIFNINGSGALILAAIPPAIYLVLCFKLKADTQVTVAAFLSVLYAFLMLVVVMSIIGTMVKDRTILTPSSIFIIAMAIIYIITAIMHPQEFPLLSYSIIYIFSIPSAYLLLIIYSIVNMNNVSWGTRESNSATGAPVTLKTTAQKGKQHSSLSCYSQTQHMHLVQPMPILTPAAKSAFQRFLSWAKCCKGSDKPYRAGKPRTSKTMFPEADEEQFWWELQEKYLQPLPYDERSNHLVLFFLNSLWLVAAFTLQTFERNLSIQIPMVDLNLEYTDRFIVIDPIALMFILGFALTVLIQFFAMLYHRISTLIHYVAFLDTEPKEQKMVITTQYSPGQKVFQETTVVAVDLNFQFDLYCNNYVITSVFSP
uniref:chitin synthase n=1 Tax=Salarias fasciatus TaxID=181472 RepID=A0A672FU87_SALFA